MEKAIELLESVIDLQLGNINIDQWLQRLARQTNSAAAVAASWPAHKPDYAQISCSDELLTLPPDCLPAMDRIISMADPGKPCLLDDSARSAGLLTDSADNVLNDPAWMIALLDSHPAYTIIALRCPDSRGSWTTADRKIFMKILPVLLKAHLLHKKATLARNDLDIANKILDNSPRGLISVTPAGEILRKNSMATDMLKRGDAVTEKNGRLVILDDKVAQQLAEKLAIVRALPLKSLDSFIWNRSFQNADASQIYQLSMSAHRLESWHLESNPHDRFVVIFLAAPKFNTLPTHDQLSDFYDLTRAQARLVIALMEGKNVEAAAAHLHVSVNTIRSHLRAIYSKLGTDNKADLLRIISMTLVGYSTRKS